MDKKKITIAVIAVVIVIAIAIIVFLSSKNTNTVYTISFNTDGGNKVVSQKVEEGEKPTRPEDPIKEGYEFLGWYLNGIYFDFQTEVEGNLTLDAKWKEVVKDEQPDINDEEEKIDQDKKDDEEEKVTKYTVTFESNGGSKVSKKTVEKNKTVKAPADPTRDGYKFLGWYLGNTKYNFSKKVTKNITLTAHWEKIEEEKPVEPDEPDTPVIPEVKEYTVKFDVDGKVVSTKTVKEGEKVSEPSKPTKDGYTFKYWSLNGAEYKFSNEVKGDITLKAEWEKNPEPKVYIEEVQYTTPAQVRIFVMLNDEKVAGTVKITSTSGKSAIIDIPATGYLRPAGTYASIDDPKVK